MENGKIVPARGAIALDGLARQGDKGGSHFRGEGQEHHEAIAIFLIPAGGDVPVAAGEGAEGLGHFGAAGWGNPDPAMAGGMDKPDPRGKAFLTLRGSPGGFLG